MAQRQASPMSLRLREDGEEETQNPLDAVEGLVAAQDWPYERLGGEELSICVSGSWCDYTLAFVWRPDVEALIVTAAYDFKPQAARRGEVIELVARINAELWLGHFDFLADEGVLSFRHAHLMAGGAPLTVGQIEVLLRAAVDACERHYPVFQLLLWGGKTPREAIAAAMLDCQGRA